MYNSAIVHLVSPGQLVKPALIHVVRLLVKMADRVTLIVEVILTHARV